MNLTRFCNPGYVETPEDIAERKGRERYWLRKLGMIPTPPAVAPGAKGRTDGGEDPD